MSIPKKIAQYRERIELELCKNLSGNFPQRLYDAMCYTVLSNGKRLRPLLIYATAEALGASLHLCDNAACAIEFIHTYSLVHDDLPAMDNDQFRRGKKTCHIEYDEATAILVGDALQSLAFECIAKQTAGLSAEQQVLMISELAKASGYCGMAGGQALDLAITNSDISLNEIEIIHQMKTGALIIAAVKLGALAAHVNDKSLKLLTEFASCLGLAFQIQDDIFDLDKSQSQEANKINKACYASLIGIEKAKHYVIELFEKADNVLLSLNLINTPLAELTLLIKNRCY